MAEFNSTKLEDFSGVWVFCEQRQGKLQPTVLELLGEGRKLANDLNTELCGLLLGKDVDGIAKELGAYGADKVYVADDALLETYTTDAYAKVICDIVADKKPEIMLIAATNIGIRPTFVDSGAPTIEPHLLDYAGDLYGKLIHVELHKFLRPEMRFESVEALKEAIGQNVRETRAYFAGQK